MLTHSPHSLRGRNKVPPAAPLPFSSSDLTCVCRLSRSVHAAREGAESCRLRVDRQRRGEKGNAKLQGHAAAENSSCLGGHSCCEANRRQMGSQQRARRQGAGDATSQECCCPGVLGMLQTEPISADFEGKSSIPNAPQQSARRGLTAPAHWQVLCPSPCVTATSIPPESSGKQQHSQKDLKHRTIQQLKVMFTTAISADPHTLYIGVARNYHHQLNYTSPRCINHFYPSD